MSKQQTLSAFFSKAPKPASAPLTLPSKPVVPSTPAKAPDSRLKRLKRVLDSDDEDQPKEGVGLISPPPSSSPFKSTCSPPSSPPPPPPAPTKTKRIRTTSSQKSKRKGDIEADQEPDNEDPMDEDVPKRKQQTTHEQYAARLSDIAPKLDDELDQGSVLTGKMLDIIKKLGSRAKFTPLEKQVIEFKTKYPDTIILVEVGYRFRFFAEDAETAAKVLNVVAFPDHNFLTASIPTHRLKIHVGRLVAAGYKVGVVNQTETAALKAVSATKSAPFTRQLTALYTKSTMIDEPGEGEELLEDGNVSSPSYLMVLMETFKPESPDKVETAFVAVQPSTGDIIYDSFTDGVFRSEVETRILHLQPSEFLLPKTLSKPTEKLIAFLAAKSTTGEGVRIERLERGHLPITEATTAVSDFLDKVLPHHKQHDLPDGVLICLASLLSYLRSFGLERVLSLVKYFSPFSSRRLLALNADTLQNLEILRNETDGLVYGSLLWLVDHTKTAFGKRLLRKWVAQPLLVRDAIQDRLDAVTELSQNTIGEPLPIAVQRLQAILPSLPDLERGLTRMHYLKSSPKEVLALLKAFDKVDEALGRLGASSSSPKPVFRSKLLQMIWDAVGAIGSEVRVLLGELNVTACNEGKIESVFLDEDKRCPAVKRRKQMIDACIEELHQHLKETRNFLQKPTLEYKTVSGEEFLIEVDNRDTRKVPQNWVIISRTKQFGRYRSPFIQEKIKELARYKESLASEASDAFKDFLRDASRNYEALRDITTTLAQFDCLQSLATVANQPNYCRPELVEESCLEIRDGRHPMVEAVLQTPFVPNDISLQEDGPRCLVVTGPNMGGKSSFIRQVALISIMAQIGSYVPATSAKIGLLDGVFTRMGASDNLARGRSTFMMEMQETADIIRQSTKRSLVILDELGRGTSTYDGVAIAYATLHHFLAEKKALTLFVTHYPSLAELQSQFPQQVRNFHMSFVSHADSDDETEQITFLYKLAERAADRSYGLNVARLAQLPSEILVQAKAKSHELEDAINQRHQRRLVQQILSIMQPENCREKLRQIF